MTKRNPALDEEQNTVATADKATEPLNWPQTAYTYIEVATFSFANPATKLSKRCATKKTVQTQWKQFSQCLLFGRHKILICIAYREDQKWNPNCATFWLRRTRLIFEITAKVIFERSTWNVSPCEVAYSTVDLVQPIIVQFAHVSTLN